MMSGLDMVERENRAAVLCRSSAQAMKAHFMPFPSMTLREPRWGMSTPATHRCENEVRTTSGLELSTTIFIVLNRPAMTLRRFAAAIVMHLICGKWDDMHRCRYPAVCEPF